MSVKISARIWNTSTEPSAKSTALDLDDDRPPHSKIATRLAVHLLSSPPSALSAEFVDTSDQFQSIADDDLEAYVSDPDIQPPTTTGRVGTASQSTTANKRRRRSLAIGAQRRRFGCPPGCIHHCSPPRGHRGRLQPGRSWGYAATPDDHAIAFLFIIDGGSLLELDEGDPPVHLAA